MIGVAILSTDRPECLKRLLDSMTEYGYDEDIHIFDDSTNVEPILSLIENYKNIIFKHTGNRIGVAQNTNHALRRLQDYDYSLLFNNDCEILDFGWRTFYYKAFLETNIHHFCFRQNGLWGAGTSYRPHLDQVINGWIIRTITDFPQGALLAFSKKALETVGYFDSKMFKSYGKAHWMWSFSISESGIQIPGIHDVIGSNTVFKVHNEPSCTPCKERLEFYKLNTNIFKEELMKLRSKTRSIYTPMEEI